MSSRNRPARQRLTEYNEYSPSIDAPPSLSTCCRGFFVVRPTCAAPGRGVRAEGSAVSAPAARTQPGSHPGGPGSQQAKGPQPAAPVRNGSPVRRPRPHPAHGRPRAGHRRAVGRPRPRGARRRHGVRHSRRRGAAGLRPAVRLDEGAPRPRPPRAGRGPRGDRLRAGDRQGRRVHGDLGPRRDQPGDPARRRPDGLGPDRRDHRPGGPVR